MSKKSGARLLFLFLDRRDCVAAAILKKLSIEHHNFAATSYKNLWTESLKTLPFAPLKCRKDGLPDLGAYVPPFNQGSLREA